MSTVKQQDQPKKDNYPMRLRTGYVNRHLFDPANDFDTNSRAWIPELWAAESLIVLEENLIAANMVHRDFEPVIASFGDTVNTRRPGKLDMARKTAADEVRVQPVTAEKVAVVLNQHLHTTFMIKDEDLSKSFENLVQEYMMPAIHSLARGIDSIVLGQRFQFMGNSVGKLGAGVSKTEIIAVQKKFDDLLVPEGSRNLIVSNVTKSQILSEQQFTDADKFGDGGKAIRTGRIGLLYGNDCIHSSNLKSIATGNTIVAINFINNSGGYAAGSTALTVDQSAAIPIGAWVTIAGDVTPQRVTARTQNTAGNTTAITISPGLRFAVADNAVVTTYTPAAINNSGGYDINYGKEIVIDGTAVAIQEQGLVSLGSEYYTDLRLPRAPSSGSVQSRLTNMMLDRPLAAAVADDSVVGIGPAGDYSFGFHKNAVALVCRPLATIPNSFGAKQFVINQGGLSLRVTLSYDARAQGVLVTIDTLLGIKVLDQNLGLVLFS